MKNQIKKTFKKSLSLIMAVLMVLTCWVWVAPTQAEAAAKTSYRVVVKLNIVDSWDNGSNNFKVDATYKTNNGTGDAVNSGQQVASDGAFGDNGILTVFDKTLPGFPTQIHIWYDIAWGRNCTFNNLTVFVNDVEVTHDFNGEYKFEGATWGNATGDYYANISELAYPQPKTMEGLGGITNITIPSIDTPEDANPLSYNYTARAVDQYGVYWYVAPNYYLSQSSTGTADMGDSSAGFWWEPTSDSTDALVKASVKVKAKMQDTFPVKTGNTQDYYLVAHISEAGGQAYGAQLLHFTYPTYDWYFNATINGNGKEDGNVSMMMEDKSQEETRYFIWSNTDGTAPAIFNKPGYLAYNQLSTLLPMYAEKPGYTFYGFWTEPQPSSKDAKGYAYSSEASFAAPISSDAYFNLDEADKALYTDAGEEWSYKNNAVTTNHKRYYGWWLSNDITVKFYDIDGSYITSYNLKGGDTNAVIKEWPTPANESGYTNGAFTFGPWTGNWENIDGTVIDPDGYTFTEDLILTPAYSNASFDRVHSISFYNSTGSEYANYTKDYNYRDVAAFPADSEVSPINIYATDYRYEFIGWSAQAPSTDKTYHIVLENADYDVSGNPIYLTEDFIVRSDATYYPVFRRYAKPFEVTFGYFNAMGDYVESTVEYKYGQLIEIPEEVPEVYAVYGLEKKITGWKKGSTTIVLGEEVCTGSDYYSAVYDAGTRKPYNVSYEFRNEAGELVTKIAEVYDGYEVEADFVNENIKPYDTYDDGVQKLYFKGNWACSDGNTYTTEQLAGYYPANHVTFSAIYEDGVPFRTVTYVDGDYTMSFRETEGTLLPTWYTEIINPDGSVTKGEAYLPKKASTEYGTYEFIGWFDEDGNKYIPEETAISGDVTLTPEFEYKPYEYNFVFKNWNDVILAEGALNYGDSLSNLKFNAEQNAVRDADETYTYQFLGWDKKVPEICEGGEPGSTLVFTAQYKPLYIYYNVKWFNDKDATEALSTSKYVYGERIHTPSVTLTPDGENRVFAGWVLKNGDVAFDRNMTVTGDMEFYATYADAPKVWTVTVIIDKTSYSFSVADGTNIYNRVSDPIAGYLNETTHNKFVGWTASIEGFNLETSNVTADLTLTANFTVSEHDLSKEEIVTYPSYPMASFTDYDGTVVEATDGKGEKLVWCECNRPATEKSVVTPALVDEEAPNATVYLGQNKWTSFNSEADGALYVGPKTNFIITTSDAGIGVEEISVWFATKNYEDVNDLAIYFDSNAKDVFHWSDKKDDNGDPIFGIQTLLINNYGGWAKVPAMYKDYNANYTNTLGGEGLVNGTEYIAYIRVVDKTIGESNNITYVKTAPFIYDADAPVVTGAEESVAYCEKATIEVSEKTDYTITIDDEKIAEKTANGKYNITDTGVHKIVVEDLAGNKTIKYITIVEHNKKEYTQSATCLEAGFTSMRCLNCGADFDRVDEEPLGHDWEETIVPATCTADGYIARRCTRCEGFNEKYYYTADGSELLFPALGHTYDKDKDGEIDADAESTLVKAPTCQTGGLESYTCTTCYKTVTVELEPVEGAHSFYKAQVVKATCTEPGQATRLCRACGKTVVVETYAPTGHDYETEKWATVEALRCYAYGTDANDKAYYSSEKRVCATCGVDLLDENGQLIMKYGYESAAHTWVVDQKIAPEVGKEGKITYKCSVAGCDGTKDPTIIDALVEYTITFVGATEEMSKDIVGLPGESITADMLPAQTKANSEDGKIRYEFDGWYTKTANGSFDKKYTLPMEIGTENITLYAKFKEKDIYYKANFIAPTTFDPDSEDKFGNNKTVKVLMGAIGDARLPGVVPSIAETDYYTFTFDGWYTQGTNPTEYEGKITGDGTYVAKFTAEQKSYKVTFMNNGVAYDTMDVIAGGTATAKGTPTKDADADYHYTFKGWYTSTDGRTPAVLTNVSEKLTVYAVYEKAAHTADAEKTIVKQAATCVLPEITQYTCGVCDKTWDVITKAANGHTEGTPVYNEETGKNEVRCTECNELIREVDASFKITFVDYDGRRLGTVNVKVNNTFYDQAAQAAENAFRKADAQYEYTFAGWIVKEGDTPIASDKLPAAVAEVTYIAAYTATARTYSVTFATSSLVDGNNKAIKTFSGIVYGETTDKNGDDVTEYKFNEELFGIPASDSKVHYVFKGWDTDLTDGVTEDTVVRPAYEAVAHTFDNGVASAATCTQSGGYKYTCSECGYYYISGNVPAQGHNYVSETTKQPSFTDTGILTKTCQRCGDVVTEVLPQLERITVTVTVADTAGNPFYGAKVQIAHKKSGATYGPNLTDDKGVATFLVDEAGEYFVTILEIPGREGGLSGYITVNESGEITKNDIPVLKAETTKSCSCGCHRDNFWGMLFRFFHNIIKLLAGRHICCECPDSRY